TITGCEAILHDRTNGIIDEKSQISDSQGLSGIENKESEKLINSLKHLKTLVKR
ncbi:11617_t:CDS:1, partial [Gigaspora rosea]